MDVRNRSLIAQEITSSHTVQQKQNCIYNKFLMRTIPLPSISSLHLLPRALITVYSKRRFTQSITHTHNTQHRPHLTSSLSPPLPKTPRSPLSVPNNIIIIYLTSPHLPPKSKKATKCIQKPPETLASGTRQGQQGREHRGLRHGPHE